MTDTKPTKIHATAEAMGIIPAPGDTITNSAGHDWNAGVARNAIEADKHGCGEKLLAQIWP